MTNQALFDTQSYINQRYRYLLFPNTNSISLPSKALVADKDYRITLEVEDISTNETSIFSTHLRSFSGSEISVSIDSRESQDGYIDYSQESLFVGLPTLNNTGVDVTKTTFTWTLTDSIGNLIDLTSAIQVQNSLKILKNTLEMNQYYMLKLNVTTDNLTGTVSINYNTMFDSKFSFEISPTSGIAFNTDFIISSVTQEIDSLLTNFIFGYIKEGKEYFLTRDSPRPLHIVQLPPGDSTNQLTVFLLVSNNQEVFRFERNITVTAPIMSANDFMTEINATLSDSVDESMKIFMKYNYFKSSIGSMKLTALNLILDGFLIDGTPFHSHYRS